MIEPYIVLSYARWNQVLAEQATAVAAERLGDLVGHVSLAELQAIDSALRLAMGLD